MQDLIEDFLANRARSEPQVLVALAQVERIARHPKTTYATHYLDLLQNILHVFNQSEKVRSITFVTLAAMVNNGNLQFSALHQILTKKFTTTMPHVLKGPGYLWLLESCR